MSIFAMPGFGLKHIDSVCNAEKILKPKKKKRPSDEDRHVYKWPVDGADRSVADLVALLPDTPAKVIRARLNAGDRTLADLGRPIGGITTRALAAFKRQGKDRVRKRRAAQILQYERMAKRAAERAGHKQL